MAQILIVEDENIVALDIRKILTDMGHEVMGTATSGEECIRYASEHCPDLVLMDIRIKGNLDGIATAGILRDRFDVPIVYLTAHADDETINRAKITAPFGYLLKPFKAGELKSLVEIALSKHDMERRIRQREKWLSTSLQAVGDAVITVNKVGEITFLNAAAETITGYTQKEVEGKKLVDVLPLINEHTRELVQTPIIRILKETKTFSLPADTVLVGNESESHIENTTAIMDETGEMAGAVIVFRSDEENRERMQQQVALADRLTSLGTLVSGVAHEINNPLSVIVANATFVADELEKNKIVEGQSHAEMLESIKDVQEAAERVRRIVADLKFFSQPQSENIKAISINEVLDWAIRVTSNQVRHCGRLIRDFSEPSFVNGSELRLGQVFINLIVNAVQAMDLGSCEKNEIKISTISKNGEVFVKVSDNGAGIGPDTLKRIFDPFFTTKPVGIGTGLGLSISNGIINSLGGVISAESKVGVGSTFVVRLPAVPEQKEVVGADNQVIPDKKSKILVVDDEPLLLKLIHRTLSSDHEIVVKESSLEALQYIKSHPDFDVILCDLMMPEMNGMELYDKVADSLPELARKFAFMTGGAFTQSAVEFISTTANRKLDKPFTPNNLKLFVRQILTDSTV